jgi:hypothetical protein
MAVDGQTVSWDFTSELLGHVWFSLENELYEACSKSFRLNFFLEKPVMAGWKI